MSMWSSCAGDAADGDSDGGDDDEEDDDDDDDNSVEEKRVMVRGGWVVHRVGDSYPIVDCLWSHG